jgi:nucleoside-diphosphate-sugar epimerase
LSQLLLTGVPGWLTAALLEQPAVLHENNFGCLGALVQPSSADGLAALKSRFPDVSSWITHDLSQPVSPKLLEGFDAVLHTAAIMHVHGTGDWYRVNTEGTIRLATAAKEAGVRRFVFVSSNAAGGRSSDSTRLMQETDPPQPLSHYGKSKLLAEQGLLQLHEPQRFEVSILRPSMFYGPPVPDRHIDVYRRILTGRMPMIGGGDYARSVTHISHLVQACILALTCPAASGQTYYIVDDEVYTTRSICEAMAAALGTELRPIYLPGAVSTAAFAVDRALAAMGLYWQTLHLVGEGNWHVGISCEKAKRELGYRPASTLNEGMRQAVNWCRSQGKL